MPETSKPTGDNPFAQALSQAKAAADEFTKMLGGIKFPGLPDTEAMLGAHRRNMEALSSANRIALEGAQTVAKRNMEIIQQTMAELTETVQALASSNAPHAVAEKQMELLRRSYERAVANTTELSELIQRSNREALEQLTRRFTEAVEEVKRLVDKSSKGG